MDGESAACHKTAYTDYRQTGNDPFADFSFSIPGSDWASCMGEMGEERQIKSGVRDSVVKEWRSLSGCILFLI